jgi:catechol 2,3-dioxygenase-like lactoylglutathione lyase family enzyme
LRTTIGPIEQTDAPVTGEECQNIGQRSNGVKVSLTNERRDTMAARLEHANINVRDIDEAIRFITTAFPEFRVRGRGEVEGRPWVHVGTDTSYLALNEFQADAKRDPQFGEEPLNHLGFVVDDAEQLAERLRAAGFQEGFIAPAHPYRIRKYFLDGDGNEWEFVEYLSDDPAQQNEY